jgi:RNA polymerase sigma factor (sigma-70 family)
MGGVGDSLQTLFRVGTLSGLTDGQLLERFAQARGDPAESQAAFTVLVERHGPMVLGVCRAVLGNRHDAEDACQATFLVLAQRAGLIRRSDSVASWLYGVARRVALRARRQAARRRECERRRLARTGTGAMEPVVPPPAEPWPELYEELDRLPEPFRAAVVLCDLEGHSYEQAAGRLHCPVGTIQSRLARGRQRLRFRLQRRGFSAALTLVGPAAQSNGPIASGSLSPRLATALARTAAALVGGRSIAGAASGTIVVLARSEIRSQIMTRVLAVLTTMLLAGLMATALIGLAIAARRNGPQPQPQAIQKADAGPMQVRVVDAQEKGVPRVVVEVRRWREAHRHFETDADGRATLPRDVIGEMAILVARRDRESLAWGNVGDAIPNRPAGTQDDPIVMKLLPLNHRVEGSVVDQAGKPIAGVEMVAASLGHPTNGSVFLGVRTHDTLLASSPTDQAGRFVMMLPEEAGAGLRATHPRYFGPWANASKESRTLEPVTLEPAGGIIGRMTDAATGKPVAGAAIGAQLLEHRARVLGGWGEATTDEQGRFVLGGLEPGVYNLLFQDVPGRAAATARAVEALRVRPGADTSADMTVLEGRPLRGIVIDRETDRPVAGIQVGCYGPARPQSGAAVESRRTDHQGRFTFHTPPGEQVVYLMDGSSFGRLSRRRLVVPEQGEIELVRLVRTSRANDAAMYVSTKAVAQPIELKKAEVAEVANAQEKAQAPAPKVRDVAGRVRHPQGWPLAGVQVYVNPGPDAEPFDTAATDRESSFILPRLPRRRLTINLHRPGFTIQVEALPPDRDQVEFTFRLEPDPRERDQPGHATDEPLPSGLRARLTFVDLDRWGTDSLAEGPGGRSNDLSRLPRGVHRLGDAYFRIGEEMVHVRGQMAPHLPQAVKGIQVGARGQVLYILHATQYGVETGTLIGAYVIHYADGSHERIPIVYRRNLANWWRLGGPEQAPTEAKVAWTGTNDATDLNPGITIRLFAMTWTNPHPEKAIAALDVLSAGKECDPFVVAVTLERDR